MILFIFYVFMLLTNNFIVSLLFAVYFKVNVLIAIILGIFIYFFLNLIPHYACLNSKKNFLNWIILILDVFIASFFFIFAFVSVFYNIDLSNFIGLKKNIFISTQSWFILFSNTLISSFFFLLENFYLYDKFLFKIVNFKRNIEFFDNSFWGLFIHIAIPILGFLMIFGFLDFRIFLNMF